MDFFRGDNRAQSDMVLQSKGFTSKGSPDRDGNAARKFLLDQFSSPAIKTPHDLAFKWRVQTPGGLIATAMVEDGAYTQTHYFYKITIPDNELTFRRYLKGGAIGPEVPLSSVLEQRDYLIMHNGSSYETADIIALYHGKANTKEVTFITPIPPRYISGFRAGAHTGSSHIPFIPFHRPANAPWKSPYPIR